jgi:hypothetical protein
MDYEGCHAMHEEFFAEVRRSWEGKEDEKP